MFSAPLVSLNGFLGLISVYIRVAYLGGCLGLIESLHQLVGLHYLPPE